MASLEFNKLKNVDIFIGDCLNVMPYMDDNSIDLIFTDLPFGTTALSWDRIIPIDKLWVQYKRLLSPTGVVLLHGTQPFGSLLVVSNLQWFHTEWILHKTKPSGFVHCNDSPLKEHESLYMFSPGGWTYNPQMTETKRVVEKERTIKSHNAVCRTDRKRRYDNQGLTYPRSIITFPNTNHNNIHPTQKSLEMAEYFIRTYSNEGDTVLDSCMGSGTTGVACQNTNRKFFGIEQDPVYWKKAVERMLTNQESING
jgi:site-specific DNA-methyltransferase (adenine-specific)